MSKVLLYKVIEEYDESRHGKFKPSIMKLFSMLKTDMEFRPVIFAKENIDSLVKDKINSKDPLHTAKNLVFATMKIAKRLNLVKVIKSAEIETKKFQENPTVQEWFNTLAKTNYQNINAKHSTTGTGYLCKLRIFDQWINRKSVTYKDPWLPRASHEEVKECTITFSGVESMCNHLKKNRHLIVDDFILLVEQFLNSSIHDGLSDTSKVGFKTAINSYFKYHRTKIHTDWKPSKNGIKKVNKRSKKNKRSLTLEDISDMILLGSPTPRDLAILMIMFHRGLDKSTFCDRFNFQAWEQLVDYFGTESWYDWDLSKCPVPIELERVKTDVESFGFLEKDAIQCLQLYLDDRYDKTGTTPRIEEPLVLSYDEKALHPDFCYRLVRRLAKRAKKQHKLSGRTRRDGSVYDKISVHLLRHTLETIIENNVKGKSLADSAINHAGTYNDSAEITPEILRSQYATLAPLINLYSKMKTNINGDDPERVAMQMEIDTLKNENTSTNTALERVLEINRRMEQRHAEEIARLHKRLDEAKK